jgi:hypothetical protein
MKEKEVELNKNFKVKYPDYHSVEHLKFIFYQAEKRLDESHKVFDSTTNKSFTLITFCVAILSTLTAYFFVNNQFDGEWDPKLTTVFIVGSLIYVILAYVSKNVQPVYYKASGSLPSILLTAPTFKYPDKVQEELQLKDLYYGEIVNYDNRINENLIINDERLLKIKNAVTYLSFLPIVGLLIYVSLFSLHLHS